MEEGRESTFVSGSGSGGGTVKESSSPSSSLSSSPSPTPPGTPSPTPSPPPPESCDGGDVVGAAAPVSASGLGISSISAEDLALAGKKRGRPPNYGTDGSAGGDWLGSKSAAGSTALSLSSPSSSSPNFFSPLSFSAAAAAATATASDLSSAKRGRGRPPGSGKRKLLATLGEWFAYSAGGNFTPHVVTIAAGEDVAARIMSFSQKGPRAICILSANGTISNVTLRQPGSSGGTLTYEGRFEILSLSGSFTITENSGVRSRTGGISVSLAGPDGRVVGGGVAGLLLAASPIQVIVGSFLPNTFKEHKMRTNSPESLSFSPIPATAGVLTAARPLSQANPDDDCKIPTSTLPEQNRGMAENSKITHPNPNLTSLHPSQGWHGLQHSPSEQKPSPDINLSLPRE